MATSEYPEKWLTGFRDKLMASHIPGLDGIRALAVALVIIAHFGIHQSIDGPIGGLGVMMFFVLSGFLITWLLLKEVDKTQKVSVQNFYWRRILRILPAFYTYWIVGILIYLYRGHDIDWGMALSAMFYFSNYYAGIVQQADTGLFGHTWSLCVEEQFYLFWPLIFILFYKNVKQLTWILIAIILAVWIHRTMLVLVFDVRKEYLAKAFDTRLDHLMIGCLMAVLIKRGKLDWVSYLITKSIFYPAISLILLISIPILPQSHTFAFVVGFAFEPILICVFIVQLIWFADQGFWRVFQHPITRYLGRISYSLYLWQQLTLFTAKRLADHHHIIIQFAFALAVTIMFASGSYFIVEKPFLNLKNLRR